MKKIMVALILGGLVAAGCGGDAGSDAAGVPPDAEPSDGLPLDGGDDATFPAGMGPGISVAEALDSSLDEQLLVNGYVFVYADGTVVIADAIAESFPPQPGGATVTVDGLDLMQIPLTEGPDDAEIEITAWTDTQVQLVGEIVDGVFVGGSVSSA